MNGPRATPDRREVLVFANPDLGVPSEPAFKSAAKQLRWGSGSRGQINDLANLIKEGAEEWIPAGI